MTAAHLRVLMDRLNTMAAWAVVFAVGVVLAGLVLGMPPPADLLRWLDPG